jgi:hypothetical protein
MRIIVVVVVIIIAITIIMIEDHCSLPFFDGSTRVIIRM